MRKQKTYIRIFSLPEIISVFFKGGKSKTQKQRPENKGSKPKTQKETTKKKHLTAANMPPIKASKPILPPKS